MHKQPSSNCQDQQDDERCDTIMTGDENLSEPFANDTR